MYRSSSLFVILALLAGACERPGESTETQLKASKAVGDVMAYPQSSLLDVRSGSEAAQVVLRTPADPTTVAAWYRVVLPRNDWVIKTDTKDRVGTVTIYAERQEKPLWITIQQTVGGPGTTYKLVGVFAVDSASMFQPHRNP